MSSKCSFPDHHGSGGGGGWLTPVLFAAAAFAVLALAIHLALLAVAWLAANLWLLAIPGAAIAARLAVGLVRFARAGNAGRRNYPAALWYRLVWPRWCVREGLGYRDRYRRRVLRPRVPGTTATRVEPDSPHRLVWPRARFRPDAYGWTARVKTTPKVGRAELEAAAQHLADHWHAQRVTITQARPGRLDVRSLRTDPLADPFTHEAAPAGTYPQPAAAFPGALYLGRDEHGQHRHLPLAGVTGITVAGLPGSGKSTTVASWLAQFAPCPAVAPVLLDGKDAGDHEPWRPRAWMWAGDDLDQAQGVLEDCHAEMRKRRATVQEITGHRNAWAAPITEALPLLLVVIDECQTYLDIGAARGNRQAEDRARRMVTLVGELVRKGRSVLVLVILATQKPTSDSLPTTIRDNCALSVAFAVKTREAAVAALGDSIRDYPTRCPTTHQGPEGVGIATASLRTGLDPFTRLRAPELTEAAAAERAAACVHLRRDLATAPLETSDLVPTPALVPVPALEPAAS
jgi:S-DNA-T family DNA segregation ATPase FtsK/SpoIIIE